MIHGRYSRRSVRPPFEGEEPEPALESVKTGTAFLSCWVCGESGRVELVAPTPEAIVRRIVLELHCLECNATRELCHEECKAVRHGQWHMKIRGDIDMAASE